LLKTNKAIGETYKALKLYGTLNHDGTLPYRNSFLVARISLLKTKVNN
jgi:hypothetical protein